MTVKYELITPDGETFNTTGTVTDGGYNYAMGTIPGTGLPEVEHVTHTIPGSPGSVLTDIIVKDRIVQLTFVAWGKTVENLIAARAAIFDKMRWNRSSEDIPEPTTLRATIDAVVADLAIYYKNHATARTSKQGGLIERITVRLAAHNPMWRGSSEIVTGLSPYNTLDIKYIIRKHDGVWGNVDVTSNPTSGAINAMALGPDNRLYIAGTFYEWDGVVGRNYIAAYDIDAGTWHTVGGASTMTGWINALAFTADGTLYIGGAFLNVVDSDGDYLVQYDIGTDTISVMPGGSGEVNDLVIGRNGLLYICGEFTHWGADAEGSGVVSWDGSSWGYLDSGLTKAIPAKQVTSMAVLPNGDLVVGGMFDEAGSDPLGVKNLAIWRDGEWIGVGAGVTAYVLDLAVASDGVLYIAGGFTLDGDGNQLNYAASWDGSSISPIGDGFDDISEIVYAGLNETIYYGGDFTVADGVDLVDSIVKLKGNVFSTLEVDFPSTGWLQSLIESEEYGLFIAAADGTAIVPGTVTVTNSGSFETYPEIKIVNGASGNLFSLRNETTGKEILFNNLLLFNGETITIDLSPGAKTVENSWAGNVLGEVKPTSDINIFSFESDPTAPNGQNTVSCLVKDATPQESGDGSNQLSSWIGVLGLTLDNTDNGTLYVSIVDEGGGDYRVDLYSNSGRTAKVGHTGSYSGAGTETITADNSSGISGTIVVDAATGADVNIEVIFTIIEFRHYDRWTSLDEVVK